MKKGKGEKKEEKMNGDLWRHTHLHFIPKIKSETVGRWERGKRKRRKREMGMDREGLFIKDGRARSREEKKKGDGGRDHECSLQGESGVLSPAQGEE